MKTSQNKTVGEVLQDITLSSGRKLPKRFKPTYVEVTHEGVFVHGKNVINILGVRISRKRSFRLSKKTLKRFA